MDGRSRELYRAQGCGALAPEEKLNSNGEES